MAPDSEEQTPLVTLRKIGLIAFFLGVFAVLIFFGWYYSYINSSTDTSGEQDVVVVIPQGSSVRYIGKILAESDLIKEDIRFLLLAKFSGYGKRLQAGEFAIPAGLKPEEILHLLASSMVVQHAITIPEGLRATEIARIFAEDGWCDLENFIRLTEDRVFLDQLGLAAENSVEGYLFPDTYHFTRDFNGAGKIIKLMVNRSNEVWKTLANEVEFTPERREVVTLASIVEKETGAPEERPLIAGVFQNRLKLGMRLQSDPTVVYTLPENSGPITRKQLRAKTPYNTYVIKGLPIGPICNPGKSALEAVMQPATTESLYFVSKNDGTHIFSKTLREHNRAVRKYQRKKKSKKGK